MYVKMEKMHAKFETLVAAFQAHPDSQTKTALQNYMNHMLNFILEHKDALYAQTTQNGYPPTSKGNWQANPSNFVYGFEQAVKTFENNPNAPASLIEANESFTQLSWLVGKERTVR